MRAKTSSATFTRPDNATPYAALDVVGDGANIIFLNVHGEPGVGIVINRVEYRVDVAAVPTGMSSHKLHLFNAAPTPIADNAAFNLIAADREKYLGAILIDVPIDIGNTLYVSMQDVNFQCKLADASNTLYGVLTTDAVFTPSALCVKTLRIHTLGV